MEDVVQVRKRIGELADKVYDLIGKSDGRKIDRIMDEIIDLNEFEMILTDRKRSKRRYNKRRRYTTGPIKDIKEIGW